MIRTLLIAASAMSISACMHNPGTGSSISGGAAMETGDAWFDGAQATLDHRKAIKANKSPAKNVILFVADGMDPTTVAAARIYDGQSRGEDGEENLLSFERFPYLAMSKTYNTDSQTPDSAGTMTAMATGYKTRAGVISVKPEPARGDCAASLKAHAASFIEQAEQAGLATGVVSTARLTHATPAATYAHVPDRGWERDSTMPEEAITEGCKDIASQLIDFPYGDGIDLAMGGGRANFMTDEQHDPEDKDRKGGRKDGRDLIGEWKAKSANHKYVWNRMQFEAIDPSTDPRVLGLFERSHMQYEADRDNTVYGEPSLEDMTRKAIEVLSRDEDGFALVVEAGRVDHAHHGGNAKRALHDAQEYAQAVAAAYEMTSPEDTLIVVTADHGHTLTFAGYPSKGNNILGLVSRDDDGAISHTEAADGKPYTTLGYANGPGSVFHDDDLEEGRPAPTEEQVSETDYQQQALVPLRSETHGGQDVTIYAIGPNAYLFGGTVEQNYIYHVIVDALGIDPHAN